MADYGVEERRRRVVNTLEQIDANLAHAQATFPAMRNEIRALIDLAKGTQPEGDDDGDDEGDDDEGSSGGARRPDDE